VVVRRFVTEPGQKNVGSSGESEIMEDALYCQFYRLLDMLPLALGLLPSAAQILAPPHRRRAPASRASTGFGKPEGAGLLSCDGRARSRPAR
jgi:hypothetical protein